MAEVKLTKKQRGFIRDYVLTENGVQSALKNYDVQDYKTASVIASENLDKPYIADEINRVRMSAAEMLSDELLAERHLELLNKREVYRIGYGEDTEYEVSDQPDTQAVKAALDMAYKLKGSYAAEKSVVVNVELESDATIDELTNRLNGIHKGTSLSSDGESASSLGTEVQDQE